MSALDIYNEYKRFSSMLKSGKVPDYLDEETDLSGKAIFHFGRDVRILIFPQYPAIVGKPMLVETIRCFNANYEEDSSLNRSIEKYIKDMESYREWYPMLLSFYAGEDDLIITADTVRDIFGKVLTELLYQPKGIGARGVRSDFLSHSKGEEHDSVW